MSPAPATTAAARLRPRQRRPLRVPVLPALPPGLGRWALALAAACALLAAGYLLWFRDSAFVRVEHVTVTGVTTEDGERLRMTLTSVARSMTTLHVDRERLERAVAGYPVVRALELRPDFPHRLHVHVVEHRPAAIAVTDGGRVPVAGDGTVLDGLPVEGALPTIAAEGGLDGDRLEDRDALRAARVAGAAPAVLRGRLEEVAATSTRGLVAQLRDGPELVFGGATKLRAKWIAAARVLADPEATGATYIDVRLPGRPAAGGLAVETVAPVAPAGEATAVPPAPPQETVPAAPDPAVADPALATPAAPVEPAPVEPVAPAPTLESGAGGGATAEPQP